ncbi:type II-A CRISPR-associated protein Csn2 [Tuanshanicoccus lijuaniae]|uniref:type II-A CRISPR-associated protein Csn2 n=1 Tax=Aerococcaceae bacterium zg-1292 TaxID=2774330 RepID=UPI001BD81193|nr:type II-A CRISPR-associated protein Csn2 [Aerococcaceae bacterium zg-BR9]MBS4456524.1 type II-A CRISPR-associated protein Csn2 [Aerococcaceae bacterium zg-A91]MBS4458625.1 type II-A CRISPR-associated protein Csn2 [Aerococcaceae bacterium zg-BR33]
MLKFKFPILDDAIEIDGGTVLAIEDVNVFSNCVKLCYHYETEGELKIFTDKFKVIKETELMIVTDVLGYDINCPSVLKLIHADLEYRFNEQPEVKSMIEKLATTITELIAFECLENELDLEYDEITILELIKALGIKIETQSDTIFDKCLEILQVFHYLSKKKLLVFVNVGSYLTKDEINLLMEYIKLSQLTVLFIEPRKLYDLSQYVLDNDYFLLKCEQ